MEAHGQGLRPYPDGGTLACGHNNHKIGGVVAGMEHQPCGIENVARPDGSNSVETRVVDPTTGGEKGRKIDRYDLIPAEFEQALAVHYGVGARKYADRNWERGYLWSLSIRALRSHFNAWCRGEDHDPETGTHHLIAVAWHACALFIFQLRGLGTDDRNGRAA